MCFENISMWMFYLKQPRRMTHNTGVWTKGISQGQKSNQTSVCYLIVYEVTDRF